jgi:hypothetical protein
MASLAVEAKSGEPLDKPVAEWLADAKPSSRKPERLAALKGLLGIADREVGAIRYQLLHRAASALLEAGRFRATTAVLLIQSFNRQADEGSWKDFQAFAALLGGRPSEGALTCASVRTAVPLHLGWVSSQAAGEAKLAAAV